MRTRAPRTVLLLLAALVALPAMAQKRPVDPRPLQGLDRSAIPRYSSVGAFLKDHPGADLKSAARVTGQATMVRGRAADLPSSVRLGASAGKAGAGAALRIQRAPNGTVRWMEGRLGQVDLSAARSAGKAGAAAAYSAAAASALEAHALSLKLRDPARELRPIGVAHDETGAVHARFEQMHLGVPVWGRDLYVHLDAAGAVFAINGSYEPSPSGLSATPALPAEAALDVVVASLRADGRWAPVEGDVARQLGLDVVTKQLVFYPDGARGLRLAYEVSLHPNLVEWYTYLVDASTGEVLNRIARHCSLQPDAPAPKTPRLTALAAPKAAGAPVAAGSFQSATATDLNGVSQNIRVYQHTDGTFFQMWDLGRLDATGVKIPEIHDIGGSLILTTDGKDFKEGTALLFITSGNNVWNDPTSVSAHVNAKRAYDYFFDTHSRNAIDHKDQSLISLVKVTDDGQGMDNAFWNGRVMVYGDGLNSFKPLAGGLDVAAHEMSHGVVQHTANLIYQFQPGALNESFADVFGMMVDNDDFLMGEDIMKTDAIALRDMEDPTNPQADANRDVPAQFTQPGHMRDFRNLTAQQDNGGVHINSGIPNKAAVLVVKSLGRQKTERIYYHALSNYLTRNSEFVDARNSLVKSAEQLFGAGSTEAAAVASAFDQVGVAGDGGGGDPGNPGDDNDVPPVTGGTSYIAFLFSDGTIARVDPLNIEDFVIYGGVRARVNQDLQDRAQLTMQINGEEIWFVNPQGRLAFMDINTGQVSTFEGLQIQQAGDLWNASIEPGGSVAALVSAYENDAFIYITDGQNVAEIELKAQTTQDGVLSDVIRYPDVISWSPNAQIPRIAFDAYNEVEVDGLPVGYWSVYEIAVDPQDIAASKVFSLIPAQPSTISIGNITHSKVDPDIVAFNVIDEEGVWDVALGNFESGDLGMLELPSRPTQGVTITDSQRPSFSPDGRYLTFTSEANSALLFYDLSVGEWAGAITFPATITQNGQTYRSPIYNPLWFVTGGETGTDVDEEAELPTAISLSGNYPNPFNPETLVRFELPAAGPVELKVYDLLGREVATLVQGVVEAGPHEVRFDAAHLPSGVYVARLKAGQIVRSHKMVLAR